MKTTPTVGIHVTDQEMLNGSSWNLILDN